MASATALGSSNSVRMIMSDDRLSGGQFQRCCLIGRQPPDRGHTHRRTIAPAAIRRRIIGERPL